MRRRAPVLLLLFCVCTGSLYAQDLAGIKIHGFATQGFLFSSHNNYLTMKTSSGSFRWTDGAINVSDSLTDKLRVGVQLHMYQLGQIGGAHLYIDWASGDYRVNDHFGFRAGKVKTVFGLFNDSQDVDAIFLWTLLPQCSYQVDNASFLLSHLGGEVYGSVPLGRRGGKLRYDGFAGEATADLNGGFAKRAALDGLSFTTAPAGKTYGGDLRWETPLRGLLIGSSANVVDEDGRAPAGTLHINASLISAQYAQFTKAKFDFAGGYDRNPTTPIITIGRAVFPVPIDERAWFAMASYRVSKKVQVGSYYSHYVNKALDPTRAENYSKDFVMSGRYDFNAYFYSKIEGHFLHGTGLGYYRDTNPNGLQPNSNILAAKIGFSF